MPRRLSGLSFLVLLFLGVLLSSDVSAQDGGLDPSFNPGIGASSAVFAAALQPNGKVLIGGTFTSYNGTARTRIARVNPDGGLDTTFDPGSGATNDIYAVIVQPDGKVLIAGFFTLYNGTLRNRIARLNADGSLDTSFNPGFGPNFQVLTAALQPDGKILIGGSFTTYGGVTRNRIARVNSDGSLDAAFNPGVGADNAPRSIAIQPDGKVLIAGQFTSIDGSSRNRVARLNPDGSLDASFNPGSGADGPIYSVVRQPDGKVLIGGFFFAYNGIACSCIARLNADGSLDVGFDPGSGPNNQVDTLALQSDGRILLGGQFTLCNGVSRVRVARLETSGSVDASFNPGSGANSNVRNFCLQPDNAAIITGVFTVYNGASRSCIARIFGSSAPVAFCNPGTGSVLACPCANSPSGSGGCNNSSATGGAILTALGNSSLALDTRVFTTTAEKPSATSIVLQGDAQTASGSVFGMGIRCVAGNLKRLYTKTAVSGSITAPQGGDPSVSARAAALGDLILSGEHRYYGVYYRDPTVLGGCPAASTFNITQQLDILWSP